MTWRGGEHWREWVWECMLEMWEEGCVAYRGGDNRTSTLFYHPLLPSMICLCCGGIKFEARTNGSVRCAWCEQWCSRGGPTGLAYLHRSTVGTRLPWDVEGPR